MGKRGPAPTPTTLKVLRGNPGKRKIEPNEPKPRPIAPKPPVWLPKEAKKIWKEHVPKLEPLGLLTEIDRLQFTSLCLAAANIKLYQQEIERKGAVMKYTTKTGDIYEQARPETSLLHKSIEIVNKLSGKFGLSPADRVGLGVKPKDKTDDFEEFLNRGKAKKA